MNIKDLTWFLRTLIILLLPLIIAYAIGFTEPSMPTYVEGYGGYAYVSSNMIKPAWVYGGFIELVWVVAYSLVALQMEHTQE